MIKLAGKSLSQQLTRINIATVSIMLLLSMFTQNAHSYYRDYYTHMHEADWVVKRTDMECRLQHKIDHYGVAIFSLHAIEGIGFQMQVLRRGVLRHKAELNSVPSAWKHGKSGKTLANITFYKNIKQFRLQRNISVTMLAELEKGREPTFSFYDKPAPNDKVTIKLSVVHFWSAYKKFLACGQTLAKYKLKKINNRFVYFDTAKYNVNSKFNSDLDRIAAYILQNDNVKQIVIEGHTDIIGGHGYNNKLSNNRASAVRRYLIKRHVPEKMIKTRYFGKRQPAATNYSIKGRTINRRAKVRIIKK